MIAWFARNHVAANILMLAIIATGLYSWFYRTAVSAFPDFESGVIQIYTSFPGSSPGDVEKGITNRIEQSIDDLEGIDEIYSVTKEGFSQVNARINYNFDVDQLRDEIQSRVFEITTLPESALRPVIFQLSSRNRVVEVVIYGDNDPRELRDYADVIYDEIIDLPEVTQALIDESQGYEITIEVEQSMLEAHQTSLREIADKINENSLDFSAGNIKTPTQDVLLRSHERAYTHEEFAAVVVKSDRDGSLVRLGDIAKIDDGFVADTQQILRFNGQPAAIVRIFRSDDESVIKIAKAVKEYVGRKQAQLPNNIKMTWWRDYSSVVKKRLGTLTSSAVQGMILVLLILSLFLRPVVALWVFIGVPVSILGSLAVLPWLGVNINVVSMLGFILLLGIVVDDAIVTGESIYRQMSRGRPPLQAAIEGTHAVNIPVTFGVLTTVAAFASIFILVQGTGLVVIFATIPAVIIPALLFSLVETKLVLPAHLSRIRFDPAGGKSAISRFQMRFSESFELWVKRYYLPVLSTSIRHRYAVLAGFFGAILIVLTMFSKHWLNFTFFPRIEGERVSMSTKMPTGTASALTLEYADRAYDAAEQLREDYSNDSGDSVIVNILQSVSDTRARTDIEVQPPEDRIIDVSMRDLTTQWREMVGTLPGSKSTNVRSEIIRTSDPVNIQLRGDNPDELVVLTEAMRGQLLTYPGVFDIEDNTSDGKEEILIGLNRTAHSLGLTRRSLMSQVRAAHFGIEAQRIQRGRNDVRVKVRLPADERTTVDDLSRLRIALPGGEYTSLLEVADLSRERGSSSILHVDLKRAVNLTADIDKATVSLEQLYGDLRKWLDRKLDSFPLVSYSFEGEYSDQNTTFQLLLFSVAMALAAIYAMLAIPLKSFLAPLIILSVIPFSLVGVVIGHAVLGYDMTVISLLGMIGLIGVIVNDSLLISSYIIKHQNRGTNLLRSVMSAGMRRFRPVFLTTLTTFFGLLPIMLERSTQAQFLIPMAISLSIGIIFATAITLIQVPVLFVVLDDAKKVLARLRPGEQRSA
ncbi:MAG: efflux RND transporter permease subunit [Gammaproteobacteria bacterium]|nr:efflux RND transporter permease subunit [Gammaproteobacteria bacterium]